MARWVERRRREALARLAKHPPAIADDGAGTVSLVWHDAEQRSHSYAVTTKQMRLMLGEVGTTETTATLGPTFCGDPDCEGHVPEAAPATEHHADIGPKMGHGARDAQRQREEARNWRAALRRAESNASVVSRYLAHANGGAVHPGALREAVRWVLHGDAPARRHRMLSALDVRPTVPPLLERLPEADPYVAG
ncbi:hypothetical protein [Corallococcus sp. 4LFB]|uniref:hypothetical protein n=1 Tax=Corallococcus sp. 4LFB TaxID=3383249 RepID=UPI00397673CA